jgi:hypothetical protein
VPRTRVGPRLLTGDQPVVDVKPVVRRRVGWIDADRLDLIDRVQDAVDVWPADDAEQDFAPGADEGQGGTGLARSDCAQDVDAGDHRAKVVRRPADEREDAPGGEADDTGAAGENLFFRNPIEANPVFNPLFEPGQLDVSEGCSRDSQQSEGRLIRWRS